MKQTGVQLPGEIMLELRTRGGSPRRIIAELLAGYVRRYLNGEARVLPVAKGEGPKGSDQTTVGLTIDEAVWSQVCEVLDREQVRLRWKPASFRGVVLAALEEGL